MSALIAFFTKHSIFEIGMLVCFGASWPFAVAKTYKTKNVKGKSRLFLALIIIGYVCGILHKIFFSPDFVIYLYVLNIAFVLADAFLCIIYGRRDAKLKKEKEKQLEVVLEGGKTSEINDNPKELSV